MDALTILGPMEPTTPVCLWWQDETRLGLHLPVGRRITAHGVKPLKVMTPCYQYSWLYAAVQPVTGETFWLDLPRLDTACFQLFLDHFSQQQPHALHLLVLDNAPAHVARAVTPPANVILIHLPPYCPELNPVERLWQHLKRTLTDLAATTRFTFNTLRQAVDQFVQSITPAQVTSLTSFPYIRKIMQVDSG